MEPRVIAARSSPELIEYLSHRRSVPLKHIGEPGPDDVTLERILKIAARVPDHGKLFPWFFVVFQKEARAQMGEVFRDLYAQDHQDAALEELVTQEKLFMRAPVVVAVVSRRREGKTPWWEQILSAGTVCHTLLLAAHGHGFAANWITEWIAYNDAVKIAMGLDPARDHIAGFIYIGTMTELPVERDRPDMAKIVTHWQPGVTLNKGEEYNRNGYGFAENGF